MTACERRQVVEAWGSCGAMVGQLLVQVAGASIKDAQELVRWWWWCGGMVLGVGSGVVW